MNSDKVWTKTKSLRLKDKTSNGSKQYEWTKATRSAMNSSTIPDSQALAENLSWKTSNLHSTKNDAWINGTGYLVWNHTPPSESFMVSQHKWINAFRLWLHGKSPRPACYFPSYSMMIHCVRWSLENLGTICSQAALLGFHHQSPRNTTLTLLKLNSNLSELNFENAF